MRKIISALTAVIVLFSCFTAYAVAPENIYREYKFYTATVYICSPETREIILRNVKPINPLDGLVNARAIEYCAVRINDNCIFDKNGNNISLEDVNAGFLDVQAKVLTGKSISGQRVLYVSF